MKATALAALALAGAVAAQRAESICDDCVRTTNLRRVDMVPGAQRPIIGTSLDFDVPFSEQFGGTFSTVTFLFGDRPVVSSSYGMFRIDLATLLPGVGSGELCVRPILSQTIPVSPVPGLFHLSWPVPNDPSLIAQEWEAQAFEVWTDTRTGQVLLTPSNAYVIWFGRW